MINTQHSDLLTTLLGVCDNKKRYVKYYWYDTQLYKKLQFFEKEKHRPIQSVLLKVVLHDNDK